MSMLNDLDVYVMKIMIMEIQEEEKRTAPFYNSVGTFLDRHKFRLEALKTRGEGDDNLGEVVTEEELEGKDAEWLLAKLDALSYFYMMEDLSDPEKRKPTLYNAVSKLLSRHEVSIATVKPNNDVLEGDLADALEAYDAKMKGGLSDDDHPYEYH